MDVMNKAVLIIEKNKQDLAQKIIENHFTGNQVDWIELPGRYREKYLQDSLYNLTFLISSIKFNNKEAFLNYMSWLAQLMKNLEVSLSDMLHHFQSMKTVLQSEINPEAQKELLSYINEGVAVFETTYREDQAVVKNTYSEEVENFTDLILNFKRDKAASYVIEKVENGSDIKEIYINLLQPTLVKVGDLWYSQKISVAKEHYASSVIQNIIGLLYPYLFKDYKTSGKVFIGACGNEELHEIGLRMVADFFEMDGWDTYYLGSNLPIEYIVEEVKEKSPDVLGISTTTIVNLDYTRNLIEILRKDFSVDDLKIMVGGKVYHEDELLYQKVGADAFAKDAAHALEIAAEW